MGRGKVVLKRIENKVRRQVSFCKRRTGLHKKAREISLLCDAQVALVVFSSNGNLFQYSSPDHSSMEMIMERYQEHVYSHDQKVNKDSQSKPVENQRLESWVQLQQQNLSIYQRRDLEPLNLRDLLNLEQQLDASLREIRTKKNQLMNETIRDLQREERALEEQNNLLAKKIKQQKIQEDRIQIQPEQDQTLPVPQHNPTIIIPRHPPQELRIPSLDIEFSIGGSQENRNQIWPAHSNCKQIPPWLLNHFNR